MPTDAASPNMLEKEYLLEVSPGTNAAVEGVLARGAKTYDDGKYEIYEIH